MNDLFFVPLENSDTLCIIDLIDRDRVMKFKWRLSSHGYARHYLGMNHLSLHNFITGYDFCDHKNRNKLDNRRCNIRKSNSLLNTRNVGLRTTNTSGYKGVSWSAKRNKWIAQIVAIENYYLGSFNTKEEAALAYNKAAIKYHGEFAFQNLIS